MLGDGGTSGEGVSMRSGGRGLFGDCVEWVFRFRHWACCVCGVEATVGVGEASECEVE